jgi:hypothetical protein
MEAIGPDVPDMERVSVARIASASNHVRMQNPVADTFVVRS